MMNGKFETKEVAAKFAPRTETDTLHRFVSTDGKTVSKWFSSHIEALRFAWSLA